MYILRKLDENINDLKRELHAVPRNRTNELDEKDIFLTCTIKTKNT